MKDVVLHEKIAAALAETTKTLAVMNEAVNQLRQRLALIEEAMGLQEEETRDTTKYTPERIAKWVAEGKEQGNDYMFIVLFSGRRSFTYASFCQTHEFVHEADHYTRLSTTEILEIYDISEDKPKLIERRDLSERYAEGRPATA